ncbi:MAG TPA: YciI family protein [Mycobacteriales bacterium]|nr:YciI family protein [Mycobacteriales bacterium]
MYALTTTKGPGWHHDVGIREQPGFAEHAEFVDELVARGVIVLGGPIDGGDPDDVALIAVAADSAEQVRAFFADDPWTKDGVFVLKSVRAWTIWLDGRTTRQ